MDNTDSISNGGGGRGLPIGASYNNAGAALTSNNNGPMLSANIDRKTVSSLNAQDWSNNGSTDSANPWFYADLGSVKAVDRLNLRWSYAHRPDKVVIEVSDAASAPAATSTDWEKVAEWANPSGRSFTDIVFTATVNARFIRIKPAGHRGAIAAKGISGPSSSLTRCAARFSCSATVRAIV
jgi:hypothetical protein